VFSETNGGDKLSVTVLKAKQIIDATGNPPIKDGVIVIDGDKIGAVGPARTTSIPEGAEIEDLGRETILPGLIDMHCHLTGMPPDPIHYRWLKGESTLREGDLEDPGSAQYRMSIVRDTLLAVNGVMVDLLSGVTTMRAVSENSMMGFTYRQGVNLGVIPGPRLLVGGIGIKVTGGHGINGQAFDGVEAIRSISRKNIDAGADIIKIYVTGGVNDATTDAVRTFMTRAEVAAAVDEAHRQGLKVAAHAHGGEGLRHALEEGCDTIEHATLMKEEEIPFFVKTGAYLVSTSCVFWHPFGIRPHRRKNPVIANKILMVKESFPHQIMNAFKAGVKVCLGTDARHGLLPYEMKLLTDFGMEPMDVIMAATRVASEACDLSSQIGTLEPGKQADLISVRGDPLEDISIMEKVNIIMRAGKRYDHLRVLDFPTHTPSLP
jgi:imidazolonepropionase-like amidohydrolase